MYCEYVCYVNNCLPVYIYVCSSVYQMYMYGMFGMKAVTYIISKKNILKGHIPSILVVYFTS